MKKMLRTKRAMLAGSVSAEFGTTQSVTLGLGIREIGPLNSTCRPTRISNDPLPSRCIRALVLRRQPLACIETVEKRHGTDPLPTFINCRPRD